jgi:hypothetical protein
MATAFASGTRSGEIYPVGAVSQASNWPWPEGQAGGSRAVQHTRSAFRDPFPRGRDPQGGDIWTVSRRRRAIHAARLWGASQPGPMPCPHRGAVRLAPTLAHRPGCLEQGGVRAKFHRLPGRCCLRTYCKRNAVIAGSARSVLTIRIEGCLAGKASGPETCRRQKTGPISS